MPESVLFSEFTAWLFILHADNYKHCHCNILKIMFLSHFHISLSPSFFLFILSRKLFFSVVKLYISSSSVSISICFMCLCLYLHIYLKKLNKNFMLYFKLLLQLGGKYMELFFSVFLSPFWCHIMLSCKFMLV